MSVQELEEKNRELSDEIKFLEKNRLEQWGKYERLLKEKQEASELTSLSTEGTAEVTPAFDKNELRTMDDVFAIKGTADELLQRWSSPHEESSPKTHEEKDSTASSGYHRRVQPSAVDSYNPKRYSFDREDSHPSSESGTFTEGNGLESPSVNGFISSADHARASSAATYEWALPAAEDDGGLHNIDYADQKSRNREADGVTSSLSEHKVVTQEIEHPGGKQELLYTDGSRKIIFADGNEKDIDTNGHVVIKFTNGDHKEVSWSPFCSEHYSPLE